MAAGPGWGGEELRGSLAQGRPGESCHFLAGGLGQVTPPWNLGAFFCEMSG